MGYFKNLKDNNKGKWLSVKADIKKAQKGLEKTVKKIEKAKEKGLEKSAHAIWTEIVKSIKTSSDIKKSKKTKKISVVDRVPSTPGNPPKSWAPLKFLKKNILFDKQGFVFVNPKFFGNPAIAVHEFGGNQKVKIVSYTPQYLTFLQRNRRKAKGYLPEASPKQKKIKTEAGMGEIPENQQWHIREYYEKWKSNSMRITQSETVTAVYPKRAFMRPGYESVKDKLPKIYADAVSKILN